MPRLHEALLDSEGHLNYSAIHLNTIDSFISVTFVFFSQILGLPSLWRLVLRVLGFLMELPAMRYFAVTAWKIIQVLLFFPTSFDCDVDEEIIDGEIVVDPLFDEAPEIE